MGETPEDTYYSLSLSEDDVHTIYFVGGRYCWSSALRKYGEGEHKLKLEEAKEVVKEILKDGEGGHDLFPMLAGGSLMGKLTNFIYEVIEDAVIDTVTKEEEDDQRDNDNQ
tara:strand:- start:12929 stop:13261 length:333 start_codon:yes stop_codon:yes gene_type:complete